MVTVTNNLTIDFASDVVTCADGETGSTTLTGEVTVNGGTFPWTVVVTDGTTPQTLTVTESASGSGTGSLTFTYNLANNAGGADAVKTISITSAQDANAVAAPDISATQKLTIHQVPATSEIESQPL